MVATDGEAAYPALDAAARRDLARARRAELVAALRVQGLGDVRRALAGTAGLRARRPRPRVARGAATVARRRRRLPRAVGRRPAPGPPRRRARRRRRRAGHRARLGLPDLDVGLAHPGRPGRAVGPGPTAPARRRGRDRQARRHRRLHLAGRPRPGRLATRARRRACSRTPAGPRSCCSASPARRRRPCRGSPSSTPTARTRGGATPGTSGASAPSCWRACRASGTGEPSSPAAGPGELTLELAARCDAVLASDPVAEAVRQARARTADVARRPGRAGRPARRRAGGAGRPRDLQRGPLLPRRRHGVGHARPHPRGPRARRGRRGGALARAGRPEAPRDAAATHRMLHARPELTPVVEHVDDGFVLLVLRRR